MALSPEEEIEETEEDEGVETSTTYRIDVETGRLTGETISGIEAIRQFVYMTLRTERYAHPIYSHDIGTEIQELLTDTEATDEYKEMEIPRLLEEALIVDERIDHIEEIEVTKENDSFHVKLAIVTDEGTLEIEEVMESDV
ncbi:MAG TPA: phage portal protein [Bacillus pumilus]|nr:phage portal protein [Bacillus pumilus]